MSINVQQYLHLFLYVYKLFIICICSDLYTIFHLCLPSPLPFTFISGLGCMYCITSQIRDNLAFVVIRAILFYLTLSTLKLIPVYKLSLDF